MSTKTKRVEVQIEGTEVIRHVRTVILEVPEDMTDKEVQCVNSGVFNDVDERSDWEVEESEGIWGEGGPTFIGPAAGDANPDVIVIRGEDGELLTATPTCQ